MSSLVAVAATVAMLELALGSGTVATISYPARDMSDAEARDHGTAIADFIWKDFCGAPGDTQCAPGKQYRISVSLGKSPKYCLADITADAASATGPASSPDSSGVSRTLRRIC